MSLSIAQRVMLVGLLVLALALVLAVILAPGAAHAQSSCRHVKNCVFLESRFGYYRYSCTEYDLRPCVRNGHAANCIVSGTYKTYIENRLKYGISGPKGNHTLTWR